jgi:hypothetical protein
MESVRTLVRIAGWPLAAVSALALYPPFGKGWPRHRLAHLTSFGDKLFAGLVLLALVSFGTWFLFPYVVPAYTESARSARVRERVSLGVTVLGTTAAVASALLFLEVMLAHLGSPFPVPLPHPETLYSIGKWLGPFLVFSLLAAVFRRGRHAAGR